MKHYDNEQLKKMSRAELKEIISSMADSGIIINMAQYPQGTKEYLIMAILDHQGKVLEEIDDEEEENLPGPLPDDPEEEEEEEIETVPVIAPVLIKKKDNSFPDWRDLPDETHEQVIRKMYIKLLEREPDPSGMQNYLLHLRSGMKRTIFEESIKSSDEYRKKHRI